METENMENRKEIKRELGLIELPTLDITPYIGKKAKIENVRQYEGKITKKDGSKTYYLQVETEIIDTLGQDKNKIELRGSMIYGLYEDGEGNLGWGENTKLGNFLKSKKAKNPAQLVGKEVILIPTTNKQGRKFLGFD